MLFCCYILWFAHLAEYLNSEAAFSDHYKLTQFIKGNDNVARYFIDTASEYESYDCDRAKFVEKTATVSADELAENGLFEFDVLEYASNEIVGKDFSDEEIYEEAIRTVAYKPAIISMKPFEKIEDVKAILGSTGGKLIFQEQVVEILNKVFGFNPMESDCIRKSI